MQLSNKNPFGEYMSRKFTMCMIALIALSLKLLFTSDAALAGYLVGGMVGVVTAYGWMNTRETDTVKELKIKGLADVSGGEQPPVEPVAGN